MKGNEKEWEAKNRKQKMPIQLQQHLGVTNSDSKSDLNIIETAIRFSMFVDLLGKVPRNIE